MADYDNIIKNILGQLSNQLNLNNFQASVNSAVDAQEALAQTSLRDRVASNLAGRGIDPGSAYAESMFTDLWAPMKGQFTSARAGATNDFYRSILSLAPTLIGMAQSKSGPAYSDGPFGVAKGYITNPEILNAPYMPGHDFIKSSSTKSNSGPVLSVGPAPGSGYGPAAVPSTSFPGDFLYDSSVLDYLGAGY